MFVKIFGPNLSDQSAGTFHVHSDSCKNGLRYGPGTRFGGDNLAADEQTVNVDDRVSVVEHVYSDQLRESPGTKPEDWLNDFWFAPCVASLPEFKEDAETTVYECWLRNQPGSFVKHTDRESVVAWANQLLEQVGPGSMLLIGIHSSSEYSTSEGYRPSQADSRELDVSS